MVKGDSIRHAKALTVAIAVLLTAGIAGCTSSGGATAGTVTLDYWAWAPGSDQEVAEFNAFPQGSELH